MLTLSQPILAGKKTTMVFSNFWNFFCYFFLIFCYGSARNTSERYFFFSLFLGLCQRILSWKEAVMVFSNFLNFFCYFLVIFCYWSGRITLERFFFIFSLSRVFPTYFGLKRSNDGVFFFFFFNFFTIFSEFSITGRVGTHQNDFFF